MKTAIPRLLMWILALIFAGIIAGCQTRGTKPMPAADMPMPATSWPMVDDPVLNWRASSEFSATFGQGETVRTFRALLTLERRGETLLFIALSPLGIPLFTATLNKGGELTIDQQVTANLDPERVLAELQFCLWPASLLNEAYVPPWTMTEEASSRTLHRDGDIVATAQWTEDVGQLPLREKATHGVVLRHRQQNYEIRIRPLPSSSPTQNVQE